MSGATYLARLTAPGTGGIATLALRGPAAIDVLAEMFRPASGDPVAFFARLRAEQEPGGFWLGRLGELGQADEVVLSARQPGPSPWFEVHCHGGQEVLRMLEGLFARRGVVVCPWPELVRRTTGDSAAVIELAALAAATTARTAAILLDQYHGAFRREVDALRDLLVVGQRDDVLLRLESLTRWTPLGRHLTTPWRVVVAGAPNVGKSSWINALAGYQRSIVSPTPGTTRDVVSVQTAIDGWPVELTDTAGLREGGESLERAGMDLAVAAAQGADLCLWLVDASAPPVWPTRAIPHLQLVVNKTDLPPAWDLSSAPDALAVSARTGHGVDALCDAVSSRLVPEVPPAGAPVPFTFALCQRVAVAAIDAGRGAWDSVADALETIWEDHPDPP